MAEGKVRKLRAEVGLNPIPMVTRATGRTIPDLTGREHVCEWQSSVRGVKCSTSVDKRNPPSASLIRIDIAARAMAPIYLTPKQFSDLAIAIQLREMREPNRRDVAYGSTRIQDAW